MARSPDLSRLAVDPAERDQGPSPDLLDCCFECGVLMLSVRQGSRFVGFQTRPSENVTLFTDTSTVPRDPPGIAYDTVYSPTGRNEAFGSWQRACPTPFAGGFVSLQLNSKRRIGNFPVLRKVTLIVS
jgi:hypothetical protein